MTIAAHHSQFVGGTESPTSRRTVSSLARAAEQQTPETGQLLEAARRMIKARFELSKHIPKGVFRDSGWDMMLELFVNREEGGVVYVKQLMIVSGEAATSAMRLIDRLEAAALIQRVPDPLDHRRVIVSLSEKGYTAMLAMLQRISDQDRDRADQPVQTPMGYIPRR